MLRDLARILVLVNRRDEEIAVPPDDWQRLLAWAERLLRRYKRHSSPEVNLRKKKNQKLVFTKRDLVHDQGPERFITVEKKSA